MIIFINIIFQKLKSLFTAGYFIRERAFLFTDKMAAPMCAR